ncbi:MAG: isopentenyl phosphate kinase [Candidatus Odinarchaeia archaeon]
MKNPPRVLIKLGGSVITDKTKPFTPALNNIKRLSKEIASINFRNLVIVHGGGSFGHPAAKKYNLHYGFKNSSQIIGVAETHFAMQRLNTLITEALLEEKVPAVSLPPIALTTTNNDKIARIDLSLIKRLLNLKLVPVLYGDVVLDYSKRFTILSGDRLISVLARNLNFDKIILCVDVDGVYTDDPKVNPNAQLVKEITPENFKNILGSMSENENKKNVVDVTGGMKTKILELIKIAKQGSHIMIINGKKEDNLKKAISNLEAPGTVIKGWR